MAILSAEYHHSKVTRHCSSSIMNESRVVKSNWKLSGNYWLNKLHLSTTVGHPRCTIISSWLLHCFSESWNCNMKNEAFIDTRGIVMHRNEQNNLHNGNLSTSSNNRWQQFRDPIASSCKPLFNKCHFFHLICLCCSKNYFTNEIIEMEPCTYYRNITIGVA